MKSMFVTALLLASTIAEAAFFMDAKALVQLLSDFESYQDGREIRYMAKASQFTGYVTGIIDASDGTAFCLKGGVGAEQAAGVVAHYLRAHEAALPRKGSDAVGAALAERYPCR